jgi:hypothetical protein
MAPHQGHPSGASAPVSQALLILQQPHPSDAALHAAVSPALAALALGTPPPLAHEVPNMHMHQTNNNRWYQCLYIKHMNRYIKVTNINHKNTQHTSVVKNLPRR